MCTGRSTCWLPRPVLGSLGARYPNPAVVSSSIKQAQSRWPAVAAGLAVGVLSYALPESLTVGPGWLLLAIVAVAIAANALHGSAMG